MGSFDKIYKTTVPLIAATFVVATAKNLLARKTVRSTIKGFGRKILTGSIEMPYQEVPAVEDIADRIMDVLDEKRIFPNRIGIDGLPGSGKSTLGRSLADRMGLKWRTLYWHELKRPYPFKEGRLYENIRLIRTQDVEGLDVIIYLDCGAEEASDNVITRDRSGALADVTDFSTMKIIGDTAFEMLGGEEIRITGSSIRMMPRPPEGYRDLDRLKARLKERDCRWTAFPKKNCSSSIASESREAAFRPMPNWVPTRRRFCRGCGRP